MSEKDVPELTIDDFHDLTPQEMHIWRKNG